MLTVYFAIAEVRSRRRFADGSANTGQFECAVRFWFCFATRVEAITNRVQVIATRVEAIATGEAIATSY